MRGVGRLPELGVGGKHSLQVLRQRELAGELRLAEHQGHVAVQRSLGKGGDEHIASVEPQGQALGSGLARHQAQGQGRRLGQVVAPDGADGEEAFDLGGKREKRKRRLNWGHWSSWDSAYGTEDNN